MFEKFKFFGMNIKDMMEQAKDEEFRSKLSEEQLKLLDEHVEFFEGKILKKRSYRLKKAFEDYDIDETQLTYAEKQIIFLLIEISQSLDSISASTHNIFTVS